MHVSETAADTVLASIATASVTQAGLDLLVTSNVARVTQLVFLVMSIAAVMVPVVTQECVLASQAGPDLIVLICRVCLIATIMAIVEMAHVFANLVSWDRFASLDHFKVTVTIIAQDMDVALFWILCSILTQLSAIATWDGMALIAHFQRVFNTAPETVHAIKMVPVHAILVGLESIAKCHLVPTTAALR